MTTSFYYEAVLMMSTVLRPRTSKTLFRPVNFSVFILELYANKFKNLIGYTNKTSLTSPLFIEVPVPSQMSERSCVCFLFSDWIVELFSDSVVFF